MNRTALRIATKAALLNGGEEPWPTIAGENVFDSRADDVSLVKGEDNAPIIIVRTEEDSSPQILSNGRIVGRSVDLNMQIGVFASAKDPNTGVLIEGWPATDAALEAVLDLMEWQVQCALLGPTNWGVWWRNRWDPASWVSKPTFTDPNEGRVRLAVRELVVAMQNVEPDFIPPTLKTTDPVYVPALPPKLQDVLDQIAEFGEGDLQTSVAQIAAKLNARTFPVAGVYPPLQHVRTTIVAGKQTSSAGPARTIKTDLLGPAADPPP
jgi:hypothetical protein